MEENKVIDYIKEKAEELRNEDYKCAETIDCRNRIADCWELFCRRAEETKVNEEDMIDLVMVLNFLTQKYYEELPERNSDSEYHGNMAMEEIEELRYEVHYSVESMSLMLALSDFYSDTAHMYPMSLKEMRDAIEEKAKYVSEEDIFQSIADAQTTDPWITEIGASMSAIRKFEELMGEHLEITKALKKNEGRNSIFIVEK